MPRKEPKGSKSSVYFVACYFIIMILVGLIKASPSSQEVSDLKDMSPIKIQTSDGLSDQDNDTLIKTSTEVSTHILDSNTSALTQEQSNCIEVYRYDYMETWVVPRGSRFGNATFTFDDWGEPDKVVFQFKGEELPYSPPKGTDRGDIIFRGISIRDYPLSSSKFQNQNGLFIYDTFKSTNSKTHLGISSYFYPDGMSDEQKNSRKLSYDSGDTFGGFSKYYAYGEDKEIFKIGTDLFAIRTWIVYIGFALILIYSGIPFQQSVSDELGNHDITQNEGSGLENTTLEFSSIALCQFSILSGLIQYNFRFISILCIIIGFGLLISAILGSLMVLIFISRKKIMADATLEENNQGIQKTVFYPYRNMISNLSMISNIFLGVYFMIGEFRSGFILIIQLIGLFLIMVLHSGGVWLTTDNSLKLGIFYKTNTILFIGNYNYTLLNEIILQYSGRTAASISFLIKNGRFINNPADTSNILLTVFLGMIVFSATALIMFCYYTYLKSKNDKKISIGAEMSFNNEETSFKLPNSNNPLYEGSNNHIDEQKLEDHFKKNLKNDQQAENLKKPLISTEKPSDNEYR